MTYDLYNNCEKLGVFKKKCIFHLNVVRKEAVMVCDAFVLLFLSTFCCLILEFSVKKHYIVSPNFPKEKEAKLF